VQGSDVHDRHRGGLDSEAMLKASALSLVGIRPRDHLDGVPSAAPALDATGGVLDLDGVPRPRQVRPPARRQALVNLAASGAATAAASEPSTLDDEHEPRLAQHREPADGLDAPAVRRLEERLLHLPPIESENLCQNPSALPHPLSSELFSGNPWDGTACCGSRWGSALSSRLSRRSQLEIDRGASRERASRQAHVVPASGAISSEDQPARLSPKSGNSAPSWSSASPDSCTP